MSLRTYDLVIPAGAGSSTDLAVSGPLFAVLAADSPFAVSFDGEAPLADVERGLKITRPFQSLRLVNQSATATTVKIIAGSGDVNDYRTNVRPQIASDFETLFNEALASAISPPNALQVAAADADRVEVIVFAWAANVGSIFIEGHPVDTSKRIKAVLPGETFRINYTGPIYIWGGLDDAATIGAAKY